MTSDDELTFADQVGRHYSRHYGLPPMTGRVLGWLLICDPPEQTATELSEALRASRSAISGAITTLESWGYVRRSRPAGERQDRIGLQPSVWENSLGQPAEYADVAALARRGLEVIGEAPPARRARLLEAAAFADWLAERTARLREEWRAHRDALRAAGDLPAVD